MNIEGYRTIIAALVGGPLVVLLAKYGLTLTPDQQTALVGGVMTLLMVAMRFLTKTPVGGQKSPLPQNPANVTAAAVESSPAVNKSAGFARVPLLASIAITVLAGCSLLGVPVPKTLNERVSAAYISVTTVRQETLSLLQAGKLTKTDAQNIETQADNARSGIDIAKQLDITNPAQASDRLTAALSVLQALETYLTQKGSK